MALVRKEAVNAIAKDLYSTGEFKKIYKNIVPVWTNVSNMPAVAVLYESDEASRDNITNSRMMFNGKILIYIYNRQSANEYEDILSELIELVKDKIIDNEYLRCETVDTVVSGMKRDGGTIHPYAMVQLTVSVKFLSRA